MIRCITITSLVAIVFTLWLAPVTLFAQQELSTTWKARVDELVLPLMEKKKTVGLVVGVLTAEGKREFYCYGHTKADGPVPTSDTMFEIGSITKPITALLLALMIEQGTIKLDDPLQLNLPQEMVVPHRGEHEITLLELATHTAGLPRNPPNLQRAVNENPEIALDPFGKYEAAQIAVGLSQLELKDEAQAKYAYSNFGYGLLGEALANKAGRPYGELVKTRIFEPLKMASTSAAPSVALLETKAIAHNGKCEPRAGWTFASLHGCGAVCSTANDMLTLLEAFSGHTETKLGQAMQTTLEPQRPAFANVQVGLGWMVQDLGKQRIWWHGGGTGGYKANVYFCLDPAVAVVMLCNTGSDNFDDGREFYLLGDKLIRQMISVKK